MRFYERVFLRDVTARDGFQSLFSFIPTQTKKKVILDLINAGLKEIEVTSFVNPNYIPQLKDSVELVSSLYNCRGTVLLTALVPNYEGLKKAISLGIKRVVVVVSASNSHNCQNVKKTINESLKGLKDLFDLAKHNNIDIIGSIPVAFGCPFEGKIRLHNLYKIVETYLYLGVKSLIFADTIGVATPSQVYRLLSHYQKFFSLKSLIIHFHDNFGMGILNFLTALDCGVRNFDAALSGIGGCPYVPSSSGNLIIEDIVFMLTKMNILSGIDLGKIKKASMNLKNIIKNDFF